MSLGKTSLLSLLRGDSQHATTSGNFLVNGAQVSSLNALREKVAYVPQENILYGDLTVEENIYYSALLFNKRGYSTIVEVMELVYSAEKLLGIEPLRHELVGEVGSPGISGGEKKRVSIAMELIKEAGVFLLDGYVPVNLFLMIGWILKVLILRTNFWARRSGLEPAHKFTAWHQPKGS